ncbi:hypothetical protein SAMN05216269_105248 [Flavobacterium xinjiangense]|uniref:Uncharacterized protein n=1 Tax=Flavobacterium xinjiangense TaxID=178356 RepID=A0A1M7KBE6_9FLAO|nr:hypothetical protein SAMN05216269_105248 [Flavobacterium xinjiangense]
MTTKRISSVNIVIKRLNFVIMFVFCINFFNFKALIMLTVAHLIKIPP